MIRSDSGVIYKIVLAYALFGSLWVFLSDLLLGSLVQSQEIYQRMATSKGLLFVLITSVLLYFLVRHYFSRITEAHRLLMAQSEDHFRHYVDNFNDIVFSLTGDGIFAYVSPNWKDAFGYELTETIGMPFVPFVHPDDVPTCRAAVQRIFTTGEKQSDIEYRVLHKNGTWIWYSANASLLRHPEGDGISFLGIGRDISQRKEAELALQEREERYRAMVESFNGNMYICSSEYRIEFMNDRLIQRTGRDATGEFCYRALHDLDTVCAWCVNDRVLAGETVTWELRSPKDGRWYEICNAPVHNVAGSVSKQAMIVDITERKRAEEDILALNAGLEQRVRERTSALEAAIREQEAFSYSVSHDLRAPLRHINSFSTILREEYAAELPEEARDYLERIGGATLRMGAMIDHLLGLSKVSRIELRPEVVDLSGLAASIAVMLRETDQKRCVEFAIEEGSVVMGDRTLLRQLLENLFGNAWKYSSGREVAQIEFGSARVEGERLFFVRDNGVGFDMTYSGKLFETFQRLHGQEFEGTGIGLAIARRIAKRHGGRIWGEGRVNEGATFYFTFPACQELHPPGS